jgi:hypothetical protein
MATEATLETKKELVDLINQTHTVIPLSNGKKIKVGYMNGCTQDKIDSLIVEYEVFKKGLPDDPKELSVGNKVTRQFYAKCAAAILINSYFGLKLRWWLKWRWLYYFSNFNGEDYLKIITEAKKKATEQEYSLAMVLLMDMTTTWTTMTKKEAEAYRHELELAREAQSLRNSHL